MKRLLMIAWYFPPVGGPGTQRSSKYCKYLPARGWQPVVLGGVDPDEHQDPTLLADLPADLDVHRLGLPPTRWRRARQWLFGHRLGRVGHRLGYLFDFPDTRRQWAGEVSRLAIRLHRERPFDAVYTTSYPYAAHFAGAELKSRLGLPWVADLRDPWATNDIMLDALPRWMRRRHARAEARLLRVADAVTCAHPGHADGLRRTLGLPPERCVCITNGFDPDDFAAPAPLPPAADGVVRIVHTGSFYGAYSPASLAAALADRWQGPPEGVREVRIRFVGGAGGIALPERPGLRCEVLPRVTHAEALAEQAAAHAVLAVFDRRTGTSNVSGKLFEYLACGRPILGVLPSDGAMAQIVRECRAGWVADCDDPDQVVAALAHAAAAAVGRGEIPRPVPEAVDRYSRPALAGQLAALLDEVRGGVPGGRPKVVEAAVG